jgi:hypothetical protein
VELTTEKKEKNRTRQTGKWSEGEMYNFLQRELRAGKYLFSTTKPRDI